METNTQSTNYSPPIHWGHFGAVVMAMVLILGMSFMEKPELFAFNKSSTVAASQEDAPHYYAYVPPASNQQPEVLGASTNPGPQIINDDGSVSPVDMGQVLGAATQGVQLSLDSIKVNAVPNSDQAVQKYFADSQTAEGSAINSTDFAGALNSGNQNEINKQAQKIIEIRDGLQKIPVPQGLVKLQKLKIIQYSSSISLLQNFTNAGQNPEQVSNNLSQFIKSQEDLDSENISVAQKYPAIDPYSRAYVNSDGTAPQMQSDAGGLNPDSGSLTNLNNPDNQ